ncbi:MAG: hypothetical protein WCJ55_05205 [Chloroflexales bacterium]
MALAGGIVMVGGLALVSATSGAARLGIAAGSYVRERARERAAACESEYAQFLRLSEQIMTQATPPTPVRSPTPVGLSAQPQPQPQPQPALPTAEIQDMIKQVGEQNIQVLVSQQRELEAQLLLIERRAYLEAMMSRQPTITAAAKQALASNDLRSIEACIVMASASAQRAGDEAIDQQQAALRDHSTEVAGLLAVVCDDRARDALLSWRYQLTPLLNSRDTGAITNRLREGKLLLERCRAQHEQALSLLRTQGLAPVWGLLQVVGGLCSDLQSLQTAGLLAGDQSAALQSQQNLLQDLGLQYAALACDPLRNIHEWRSASSRLRTELKRLEQECLSQLESYYRQRIAAEITQSLAEVRVEGERFESITEGSASDGSVTLKAKQGRRTLHLQVHADGRLSYEAYGFGDDRCLEVVYQLFDQLIARGVILSVDEPRLTPQVETALRVVEALRQLGTYTDEQITVKEDARAIVIEAGAGPAFQRVSVDSLGNSDTSIITAGDFQEILESDKIAKSVEDLVEAIKNRHPRVRTEGRKVR